ncbi:cytochrome P450 [Gloeopeniophorella convolvens]|nr:cytochrome P450 [Gloeopeniophorella convolvens]
MILIFELLSLHIYSISLVPMYRFLQIMQESRTLSLGIVCGFLVLATTHYYLSPYRKLPPGPRGYPIIGNALDLSSKQWLKFTEWKRQYGDVVYLNAAGQSVVVLNSQKVAAELLDRRAQIYSDRPRNIVASEIMTGGLLIAFSQYNDVWRRMRKAAHEGLAAGGAKSFYETQTTEALLLASSGLSDPAQWDLHIRRAATSLVLSVVYNQPTVKSVQDVGVRLVNDFTHRITRAAHPGAHLVELFPWMRYVPSRLAKWKRDAERGFIQDTLMFEGLFNTVESRIAEGDNHPSLSATLIRGSGRYNLSTRENVWLAAAMYAAGAETTAGVMAWWTLAMLVYPQTQARAQAELDAVVGRTRMPTFADYPHLPYIRAMVKEALRWRPVDPFGVPHRSTEDDWYEGMFIPKGTICIANVWQMNRDSVIYGDNAAHFDPARYLDADGQTTPGPPDTTGEGHSTYGFGRRVCVGRHLANDTLFINIAVLLWATNMQRKRSASGDLLPLDVDGFVESGLVVLPTPFECDISPRFLGAHDLLAQELELRRD